MTNNLINKTAKERYLHFIKKIVDNEKVFTLVNQGLALYKDVEGKKYFPLWSESEFANLCRNEEFIKYKIVKIELKELIEFFLENLQNDNIELAIFPTPESKGACIDIESFRKDIYTRLGSY